MDSLKKPKGLEIVHGSYAAYSPSSDIVKMPAIEQFNVSYDGLSGDADGIVQYWATLWHEIIHWTGHPSRRNRERHIDWGDEIYAFEELVAELGSAFLCAHLKIEGKLQHTSYLDHWYRQLKREQEESGDPSKSLMIASFLASQAKTFVLGKPKNGNLTKGISNLELKQRCVLD